MILQPEPEVSDTEREEVRVAMGPRLDAIEKRVIDQAVEVMLLGGSLREMGDGFQLIFPRSLGAKIAAAAVVRVGDEIRQGRLDRKAV